MDEAALAAFGLTQEDIDSAISIEVFEDNWDTFLVFEFMVTQWRATSNGFIGLDYNVIPIAFDMVGVAEEARPESMHGIRVMESIAISLMHEAQKRAIKKR